MAQKKGARKFVPMRKVLCGGTLVWGNSTKDYGDYRCTKCGQKKKAA